jgi:hypothetical protein
MTQRIPWRAPNAANFHSMMPIPPMMVMTTATAIMMMMPRPEGLR